MATKSEKLYRILQNLKYPEIASFGQKNLDYLFQIPDVHRFFDWFMAHATDNCRLTQAELDELVLNTSKGQAIWDLQTLNEMNQLINITNNDTPVIEEGIDQFDDDPEVLEQILRRETQMMEQELELSKLNINLKKKCEDKLVQFKKTEANRESLASRLNEKENILKGSLKLTSQNLQRSAIEFQTKFGDEYRLTSLLLANSEATFEQSDIIDTYILKERKLCKQLNELSFIEPLDTSKEKLFQDTEIPLLEKKIKISMKKYIETRLQNECKKSTLKEQNSILENFDTVMENLTQERLTHGGDEQRRIVEDEIQSYEKKKQQFEENSKKIKLAIEIQLIELFVLKQLNWTATELNKKLIAASLFRNRQEKLTKLLNGQKARVEFISYFFNYKNKNMETLKEMFEELISHNVQMNQTFNSGSSYSLLPQPQLSSTQIFPLNPTTINQSPYKSSENPSILFILNQVLISALKKFESESNDYSNNNQLRLKNQISTLVNDNMETYIDLATRIRDSNSKVHKSCFPIFFKTISQTIQYLYEKENGSPSSRDNYNLSKLNLIRPVRCLEEKLISLNDATSKLQSIFISKIIQALNSYKMQISQNEFLRIRRDFFVHFCTNPKQMNAIIEKLNSI